MLFQSFGSVSCFHQKKKVGLLNVEGNWRNNIKKSHEEKKSIKYILKAKIKSYSNKLLSHHDIYHFLVSSLRPFHYNSNQVAREEQRFTITWQIIAWFPPLVIVVLSRAWTRALMPLVKTSTAFIPTMDPQKKSNLSLSCLAHVGSASGQYWLLDASAWSAANRQVS